VVERERITALFDRLTLCTSEALSRMSIGQLVREIYAPRVTRSEDFARS
jgi:hypothetical protein